MMDAEMTSRMDEQSLILAPIATTVSTPATPGPSTPTTVRTLPLDDGSKMDGFDEEIVPPDRPQSTPFPQQELVDRDFISPLRQNDNEILLDIPLHLLHTTGDETPTSRLCNLPIEIHECILDHLFGVRSSASGTSSNNRKALKRWGTALRHSRRREVSELALVSRKWRALIQDRLYRHLKIKGTRESIEQANQWFFQQSHLCTYVKHVEVWFPVFQHKPLPNDRAIRITPAATDRPSLLRSLMNISETGIAVTYESPSNNCTLEEVFRFIQMTFAEACIVTLEGGERKKPPMVRQFLQESMTALPVIPSVRTLVCKGQWNLMRCNEDFQNIAAALPNLVEWHGSYAKPKSKSYISMAAILPHLPVNLTHLNLCLEADYRREAICPVFFKKVGNKTHFCAEMARSIPTLEHLQYTGRICHSLFEDAAKLSDPRTSRLKTVDLIVKNVCRPSYLWNDGSGVTDMAFVLAFEKLVLAAVKSLNRLAALKTLRIRFIDLDSQIPSLNPYFQLEKNKCTGIWSDAIVEGLAQSRSSACFIEKSESLGDVGLKDGQLHTPANFSKTRPLSIKVANYAALTGGITIT